MHENLDIHRTLGALHQARVTLELDTSHLCYLISLRVRAELGNLPSLGDEELIDLYLQICELFEPDAINPRKRATHAIQHLRDNRLLRRVDGAGLVSAGEYTLTRLGTAIVDFFIEDETLTKESLVVLTRALTSQLSEIFSNARAASSDEDWSETVVEPLKVTVGDLVSGIERRQRGMDAQQEGIRERISALLSEDWFAAVDDCEAILEDTSSTLRELNEILLRDVSHLQNLLQDIEQAASVSEDEKAVAQAQKVEDQLDRVAAWGRDRQAAWSDYYQFVQRYLRGVVRLDPDRAVSQRLRDQVAGWLDAPFALQVADEPSIRILRDDQAKVERPKVTRAHENREHLPELVPPDPAPVMLEKRVDGALAAGCGTLSSVIEQVLPELPVQERYRAAGRVAQVVASRRRVESPRERPWVSLGGLDLSVEDWLLIPGGGK